MDRPYKLDDSTLDPNADPLLPHPDTQREQLDREHLSGPLGVRYGMDIYPQGPEGRAAAIQRQAEIRESHGGLPDSSPDAPAIATSQKPFTF